tara:strand:- start:643 stop:1362 length:720 start_codon:yes stop_codon:yes gene_type:complete
VKKNIFSPLKGLKINYYTNSNVFYPTRTTTLIIKSILKNKNWFNNKKKILDLGCGSGVIGITIKKKILKKSEIYFSDYSENAIKVTKKNLLLNKLKCKVKKANLMQDWKDIKFDLIINDVSAISSFFLKKKIWYNRFIPCDSGLDGTKLTLKFLRNLRKEQVAIILPLISLSNVTKIKKFLSRKSIKYKILLREDWPLPKILARKYLKSLIQLKKKNIIDFKERFGMLIAYTEILLIKL